MFVTEHDQDRREPPPSSFALPSVVHESVRRRKQSFALPLGLIKDVQLNSSLLEILTKDFRKLQIVCDDAIFDGFSLWHASPTSATGSTAQRRRSGS